MLGLLARQVLRARVGVVVAFAVVVPLAALYGAGVLHELQPGGFRDPDAESTVVAELSRRFVAGDLVVLFSLPPGSPAGTVDDIEAFSSLVTALSRAEQDPAVEKIVSVASSSAPWLLSRDRTRTVALVTLRGPDIDKVAAARRLRPLLQADGFDVMFGGYAPVFEAITTTVERDLRRAELVALPLTLLLLLLLFRSVVSAALPVLLGAIAVAFSLAILRALHTVSDVTIFAANVATILGLGLAIDYSLFVLMRYREELPRVGEQRAVMRAMATAGRAVTFSGLTVAVSLCGLFLFPHGVLRSVAVGGIAVTLATVLLATTLLPALLAILGRRVMAFPIPFGLRLPEEVSRLTMLPGLAPPPGQEPGLWPALARAVMRRPLLTGLVVVGGMLACAAPFLRLAPSIADARALPATDEARRSQEIIEAEFTAHLTTPHEVIVSLEHGTWDEATVAQLAAFQRKLQALPGVTLVNGPLTLDPDPARAARLLLDDGESARTIRALVLDERSARLAIVSAYAVDDPRALEQVDTLRHLSAPPGMKVLVGGQSAWVVDVREALRAYTPAMVLFIALAMCVVLFLVFGSVVLPLKAIAMNLLSLTASFGAIVWVFQEGRFTSLLAYEPLHTTESSVPVLMFAIVFGLSMDYEVLLLSRVREEYLATGDNDIAVARGLARTGRLITSAALLLVVVVMCFASSRLVLIKTLAVGIAVSVFLDATVVRTLLVPATMKLLGDWNWWAPAPLARLWEKLGGPKPE
jgi:RND superfamily putative drug exporter